MRNLIIVLGDGVGLALIGAAAAAAHGPRGGLAVESAPVVALVNVASASSLIPATAASATALATGLRTVRGAVSMLPDGRRATTLFEAAQGLGMTTAIVSNGGLVDATPACFAAHVAVRKQYGDILRQMLASGTPMLVGSDWNLDAVASDEGFDGDVAALLRAWAPPGVTILGDATRLATTPPPFVAAFPVGPDRQTFSAPLETIASAVLTHAAADPDGFAVLVETQATDVAPHAHQAATALAALHELDRVVAVALEHCRRRDDTLLVVMSDHDTGGLAVVGGAYAQASLMVRWSSDNHTAEWTPLFAFGAGAERLGGVLTMAELGTILAELLGIHPFPVVTSAS